MDAVGHFLAGAKRYALLSAAEEIRLGTLIQRGQSPDATDREKKKGLQAKQKMINSNLRLVANVANKFKARLHSCTGLGLDDLLQEGCIGLNRAAEKFNPQAGYKFSTYAFWWIAQATTRAISIHGSTIKRPTTAQQIARRWKYKPAGQTLEEFCVEFNYKPENVLRELQLFDRSRSTSLDIKATSDGDSGLVDLIACPQSEAQREHEDFTHAVNELNSIVEIKDALAAIEMEQICSKPELSELLGIPVGKQLNKAMAGYRAMVREHAPTHIRDLILEREDKIESQVTSIRKPIVRPARKPEPAPQPGPVRVLVAAACNYQPESPKPEPMTAIPTNNHHKSLESEAASVIQELQAEPAPKKRRGRRSSAEVAAEKAKKAAPVIKMTVHGVSIEAGVNDAAALLKALGNAA